jgi:hypothetical protein
MDETFEYQVCAMQNGRITFVNGEWQGSISPANDDPNAALETCPTVWAYLNEAGSNGWRLVTVVNQPVEETQMQTLFLQRS